MTVERIGEADFDAAELWREHPPRFTNERKSELYRRITLPPQGTLHVSRWRGALPETAEPFGEPEFELVSGAFNYPSDAPGVVGWHLNFADSHLFVAYAGSLLAQDELQVLEHPILGSLRQALVARSVEPRPRTRDGERRPTPMLIRGVQRSLSLDTSSGLYGNAFAWADPDRIAAATTFIDPPTFTNVLAMEAPPGGSGAYDRATIEDILLTAFIGFGAARMASAPERVIIYTGGWGIGAYGGNRVLMALLQLCAARLAGVDRLVYHTMSDHRPYDEARERIDDLPWGASVPMASLVKAVEDMRFEWGVPNGT